MLKIKSAPRKTFYSIPNKGIVVCETEPDAIIFSLSDSSKNKKADVSLLIRIDIPKFRGVAVCNTDAGDKFDEVQGKRIAASRAFMKYTRFIEKRVMEMAIKSDQFTEELVMNACRLGNIREAEETKQFNKELKYTDKNAGVRKLFDMTFFKYDTFEGTDESK